MRVALEPGDLSLEIDQGETILAAARRQGFDAPNSCRNGNCHVCTAVLLKGRVSLPGDREAQAGDEIYTASPRHGRLHPALGGRLGAGPTAGALAGVPGCRVQPDRRRRLACTAAYPGWQAAALLRWPVSAAGARGRRAGSLLHRLGTGEER
ncbi:2Fe-2S iron-sulfur cluster-binding protein [Halopseudomonas pachastrellae]|nr:2Fe-2S iron-sulfur cluster-binding protein [Halopseudomonas pachastrellae]